MPAPSNQTPRERVVRKLWYSVTSVAVATSLSMRVVKLTPR